LTQQLSSLWFRGLATLRLYRRLILLENRFDEALPELPLPSGFEVRRLRPDEAPAYAAYRPDQGQSECERRLTAGHWCLATWHEGAIISAVWVARGRGRIDYLEKDIVLGDDEVYAYDLFTAPAARGQRITIATRVFHMRFLREQGYRRVLATYAPQNRATAALRRTLGSRPVGWIGYVGVGPWRRHFCLVEPGVQPLAAG
jgi:GNAT superfamily N-acetyltransferase